ncbi:MAG: SPFH domain-containing protein [Thermodesulfobacteriota bacterium]
MGIFSKIKGELVDIVEWLEDDRDTMVYRFERYNNEIKYGAKLVVREGQAAVFINEGSLADIFYPGTYTLVTENLPVMSTLRGWKYGFNSPFKAEVYFFNMRQFTNLKWGTPGPCTLRDTDFGVVRVTAFGIYALRISDPATFMREIVGTEGRFNTEEIEAQLRGKLGVLIKEAIPEAGIPVIDLEGKVRLLGERLKDKVAVDFLKLGLEVTEVQVQDLGLPEEVEKAIDKGGAMRAIGNLGAYAQYEAASSIKDMAQNPGAGGLAGAGMGMGMGMAMGSQMAQTMGQGLGPQAGPPPLPQPVQFFVAIGGQQSGPFDVSIIRQQIQTGQVTRETLVWKQGLANWMPAGQVPELAGFFGQVPPPVPPAPPRM